MVMVILEWLVPHSPASQTIQATGKHLKTPPTAELAQQLQQVDSTSKVHCFTTFFTIAFKKARGKYVRGKRKKQKEKIQIQRSKILLVPTSVKVTRSAFPNRTHPPHNNHHTVDVIFSRNASPEPHQQCTQRRHPAEPHATRRPGSGAGQVNKRSHVYHPL